MNATLSAVIGMGPLGRSKREILTVVHAQIDTEGDPSDYIHKFEDAWLDFILLNGIQGFDIWFYRKQIITMYCIKSNIPLHSMT
jgi:hypothetical protein